MKEESKYRRQEYEIHPIKNIGMIFTVILGVIAYYQFAQDKSKDFNILLILIILIVISLYFLLLVFLRLNKLLKEHNKLISEYERIKDNRDTLLQIIEDKNIEIEQLKNARAVMEAQAKMLIFFAYREDKPDKEVVMKSLNIEYDEVNNDE